MKNKRISNKIVGSLLLLALACLMPLMVTAQNHWVPQSALYEDNMTLTGVIMINGEEQQTTALELGAFCGEECRGTARPVLFPPTQRYVVQMTIYGNEGDQISFKLYDHDQGEELNLQSPDAITFGSTGLGALMNPYVLDFTPIVTISATATPEEGGTLSGMGSYALGSTCILEATPNAGYAFMYWTENGTQVSTNSSYSFVVTESRELVGVFGSPIIISAMVNPSEGGVVSGTGEYSYGATCTLTATPNRGYTFTDWQNDGVIVSTESSFSFTATESASYSANFSPIPQHVITVTANPMVGGTVSGAGTYYEGEQCVLTATPNSGYVFYNWKIGDIVVGTSATYSFTVTEAVNVEACFFEGLQLGEGETTNVYLPSYSNYKQSLTQQIYTADELGDGKAINRLCFYNTGGVKTRSYDIYMVLSEKTAFDSKTDWIPVTEADRVYSGTVTMNQGGWTTIELDRVFGYDGSSNLALVVDDNSGNYTGSPHMTCRVYNANGNQAIRVYSDGTNYNPYNPGSYNGTLLSVKNQIVLGFNPDYRFISVTANPAGVGSMTGGGCCLLGETCTLTATANEGYHFTNWTENGEVVSTEMTYNFTVTENRNLVANFALQSYAISASVNPSEGGSVSGAGNYNYGSTCTVTAIANTGYTFTNWTENGEVVSTEMTYNFTVTENRNLVANFALQSYTISASASPSEGGIVSGAGTYDYGSTCTLTATANTGYTFTNWTENGEVVSTEASYSFTVTGDRELVAIFTLQSYTISASANPSEGGSVTGSGTYNYGSTCNLTATANTGYTFTNWTENGTIVSNTAVYSFEVTGSRTLVANFTDATGTGALNGVFSIGENSHVNFSQGNLQYQASSDTWRFATNQWDYVGTNNANISQTYSGWIDLFGWGTSGWNSGNTYYHPWDSDNSDRSLYGPPGTFDLTGDYANADWGVYNAISNGGNIANQWRTLTYPEWNYVFNTRSTVSGIRFAKANVNNVNGVILLPDDWSSSTYNLNNTNERSTSFSSNTISASQWTTLENAGAVFLPAAGDRCGTSVYDVGSYGGYWSASNDGSNYAYNLSYNEGGLSTGNAGNRLYGQSVRLVCLAESYSYEIHATPNPQEGGTINGAGTYAEGTTCTLTATANTGYTFQNWTENGEVVSTEASYYFTVTGDRELVANFAHANGAGTLSGVFSVGENSHVNFSQGNLQYQASTNTWRFAENQWDYVGADNANISETYDGWIDLFGWGTSGYNHGAIGYQPWTISQDNGEYLAYGDGETNLNDQSGQADWGYNAISNGGNQENNGWRTMTQPEWDYLINGRTTASGIHYAKAIVNEVQGIILLPDDWSASIFELSNTNEPHASFNGNEIDLSQWEILENAGAVFLPSAGERISTSINYAGNSGYYWSATRTDVEGAFFTFFYWDYVGTDYGLLYDRSKGRSVRLVKDDQSNQKLSFINDDFNDGEINAGYWTATGPNVYEEEGMIKIQQNVTDNDVRLTSGYISIPGSGKILIDRKFLVHRANNYFSGGYYIAFNGDEQNYIRIAYWHEAYIGKYGIYIDAQLNGITTEIRLCDAVFDTWHNEAVLIDVTSGTLAYCIDNNLVATNEIPGLTDMPQSYFHVWFYPYGWWTGHYQNMDYIKINVTEPSYHITVSPNLEEGGAVTGAGDYSYGDVCTLTATANEGYIFTNWTENGEVVSTEATYSFIVTGNRELVANFALQSYTISPSANPSEGGNVSGAGSYDYGSTCTLTATANEGYTFMYWTENDTQVSADAPYSFVVTTNRNLVAHFSLPLNITATASPTEGGTVSGFGEYNYNETCTLTATPNEGYTFLHWSRNGEVVSCNSSYSFIVVEDVALEAVFIQLVGRLVGEGEATNLYLPSYSFFNYSFSQQIYTPEEIGTTGIIESISYYNAGGTKTRSYDIYMILTDKASFESKTDWITVTEADRVYSGTVTMNQGYWTTFQLDTPFDYDGATNLAIVIDDNSGNYTGSPHMACRVFGAQSNQAIRVFGDYTNYDPYNPESYNGTLLNVKNQIVVDVVPVNRTISATANPTEGGMVSGAGVYLSGSTCTLSAIANQGYTFMYWTENGTQVSADATYSFVVTASRNLVAQFSLPLNITATASPTEGGTISGFGEYDYNTTCTMTATPNEGYLFLHWSRNGEVVSCNASYSFTVVEDVALEAVFIQLEGQLVGEGEATNTHLPSYSFYKYSLTQQIYTPEEIGASGFIESVSYYNAGETKTRSYDIYMVYTDKTAFDNNTDWIPVTEADRVYSGTVTMNQGEWTTIELDSVFGYDGSSNLAFVVDDNSGNYTNSPHMACRVFGTQSNQAIRVYSDNTNYDPYNPGSYNGTLLNVKNQIIVDVVPVNCTISATANPTEGGMVSGAGTYLSGSTCTLSAVANEGYTFMYWTNNDIQVSSDATYSFVVTSDCNMVAYFALPFTIATVASPLECGMTAGMGEFDYGSTCTVTATANEGYVFVNWSENGEMVSGNAVYSFTVTGNRDLVAVFDIPSAIDFVDLGLPSGTLWATYNVGAQTPESLGDYFAWGETQPKDVYDWSTYQHCMGSGLELTKYCNESYFGYNGFTDNLSVLLPEDDAAVGNWGNGWIMPTKEDWQELLDNTECTMAIRKGVRGRLFTASNGNSLFLPTSGYRQGGGIFEVGSYGCYWSSSVDFDLFPVVAWNLRFNSDTCAIYSDARGLGFSVRPVHAPWPEYLVTASVYPEEGGVVSGEGTYAEGASCTLAAMANEGYTFMYWMENSQYVSSEASYSFNVTGERNLVAVFSETNGSGLLDGTFTVGENTRVQFSKGNLLYQASTGTWRFAENQYDRMGYSNANASSTYSGWIDLYCWGTSGWNSGAQEYQPYSTSMNNEDYFTGGSSSIDLTGDYADADWAYHNAIANGGQQPGLWRCLTHEEYIYMMETRTDASQKYAYATVNGVSGLVILPDTWTLPDGLSFVPQAGSWSSNIYSAEQWIQMESAGAVFLPATGTRQGNYVFYVGTLGDYWSSTACDESTGHSMSFFNGNVYPGDNRYRHLGTSVRPVHVIQNATFTIQTSANPAEGGNIEGAGAYEEGSTCSLTAIANEGFAFVNWTENNEVVSTEPAYTFVVTADRYLVAHFIPTQQTFNLSAGWSWLSTYVEQDGIDGLGMLEDGLGTDGIMIKSQYDGFVSFNEGTWLGSLNGITNEKMYLVNTSTPADVVIIGPAVNLSEHPITLNPNWNWISYPSPYEKDVNEALANLNAAEGDVLKSQSCFAIYNTIYGWYGSLITMTPGMGYMYQSHNNEDVTLVYSEGMSRSLKRNADIGNNHWMSTIEAYPQNMSMIAVVELNGEEVGGERYELAVFSGEECRGSVRLVYVEPLHRHVAFLSVMGEEEVDLSLALYDTQTGKAYFNTTDGLRFVANAVLGAPDSPYVARFGSMGVDENDAESIAFYPNPVRAGQLFQIEIPVECPGVRVSIVNALGTVVSTSDLYAHPATLRAPAVAGVYLLRIVTDKGVAYCRKLVVKN